jgi:tetratricopeptide (TPR) repeat protein
MDRLAKKDASGSLPHFQRAILEYTGYYEAYDKVGVADLQLWRISDAEQAYRKAVELSAGQFAHPLLALGAILDGQEKFVEAEAVIRKGLDVEPEAWRGHFYLALAQFGSNRLAEAEQSIREALHWKPAFPEAHLLLADIHVRQEDYRTLMSDLDEYQKLAPDGPASARVKALRELARGRIAGFHENTALAQPQP